MAKSRRSGRDVQSTPSYYIARVPTRPRPVYLSSVLPSSSPLSFPVTAVDDRRHFHFDRAARPAVAVQRVATRLAARRDFKFSHAVKFMIPEAVAICVRRKQRREVLFSIKKNGRNGGRRYRRNIFSSVGC